MSPRRILVAFVSAFAATALAGPESFSITTAVGDGADTHARAGTAYQNTVYGAEPAVRVRYEGGDATLRYIPYFRFDLKGAVASTITNATLRFEGYSTGDGGSDIGNIQVWGMADGTDADRRPAGGGWLETGTGALTFFNAPMRVGGYSFTNNPTAQAGTPAAYGTYLGYFRLNGAARTYFAPTGVTFSFGAANSSSTGSVTTSGANGLTLAQNINAFLRTDTSEVVTFAFLRPDSSNRSLYFYTRENTGGYALPTLTFTAQPTPKGTVLIVM